MALIGNDFISYTQKVTGRCSECGGTMLAGSKVLASIRHGKVQKRVCSERCRLEFDARFWDEVAQRKMQNQ